MTSNSINHRHTWMLLMCLVVVFLSGCATSPLQIPTLTNVPQPDVDKNSLEVWVQPFQDERPDSEMGRDYYGTIRGGYGNVLERLRFEKTAVEEVNDVMVNVLRNAGYRTNIGLPLPDIRTPLIAGNIKSLYGNNNIWTGDRHIEINMEICMLDSQSKTEVWCKSISGSDTDTRMVFPVNLSKMMEPWIIRLVEDKAKELIKTKSIAQSWKEHISTHVLGNQDSITGQTEDRLVELKHLLDKGLISEKEYNEKRSAIIKGL